jgi:predicted nucleic acid-binding protein
VNSAQKWLEVRRVDVPTDAGLDAVEGEAEAIILAERLRTDVLLIIDNWDGRREAALRGITMTRTLGLLNAAERGLQAVDFEQILGGSQHAPSNAIDLGLVPGTAFPLFGIGWG